MAERITLVSVLLLALTACQTTQSEDWMQGEPSVSFADAEESCEEQARNIEEEENRPEFFVLCMAALGWTPTAASPFATPATAPDPT
jgi:hypothetical protein